MLILKTYLLLILGALESIEEELLNEDVTNRSVHLSLHLCGTVKKVCVSLINESWVEIANRTMNRVF